MLYGLAILYCVYAFWLLVHLSALKTACLKPCWITLNFLLWLDFFSKLPKWKQLRPKVTQASYMSFVLDCSFDPFLARRSEAVLHWNILWIQRVLIKCCLRGCLTCTTASSNRLTQPQQGMRNVERPRHVPLAFPMPRLSLSGPNYCHFTGATEIKCDIANAGLGRTRSWMLKSRGPIGGGGVTPHPPSQVSILMPV